MGMPYIGKKNSGEWKNLVGQNINFMEPEVKSYGHFYARIVLIEYLFYEWWWMINFYIFLFSKENQYLSQLNANSDW